jgi:hypothetical protein
MQCRAELAGAVGRRRGGIEMTAAGVFVVVNSASFQESGLMLPAGQSQRL